ncbi:hypothetical protein O3597_13800 [Verrucosispora sp. WMMA2044]|uniref:Uncharacterized protein n=1 Tax=Verrucosispora sioxanthis TaxID=2499994 RepID=A0A6M1LDL2_9ACTN|nr:MULTISPECIES: hypothetical protein [Micromonospora]NEE67202.1 hypothetical protein [Verrucosispora sioxanthis]NGM16312.1 hypothetical protein [Verrucosispora sioxanthis]WBB51474.1 hypothetical protein O3597_13800 [Verrucosispora sp. WMMA2044]
MTAQVFEFRFESRFRWLLALIGVRPGTAWVRLDSGELLVRFGPWRLRTERQNVADVQRGGPYRWWRVIGPHLSGTDTGVTFGTTTAAGVCVRFVRPVPGLLPGGWPRHPGMTVTVADPADLARALAAPDGG